MKLAIRLCATKRFLYCWHTLLRRIADAARHRDDVHFIYVSDESEECLAAFAATESKLPSGWTREHIALVLEDEGEKYKEKQQQVIARMHGAGFAAARAAGARQCWTVEADVLPRPDALRMMEWALAMPQPDGSPWYDIAFCTYPNGLFIGGFGTYTNGIAEDFLPEERNLSPELKERLNQVRAEEVQFNKEKKAPSEEWVAAARKLSEEIKQCPLSGNIWEINGRHGYRRRGWMDFAYPGIGQGALVPVDWCGEGCNLLSARALALANYDGYNGQGTQDLFLCWQRWHPAGLRIACVTHSPCDHVKRDDKGELMHLQARHEPAGECKGHLRVHQGPWLEI